MNRKLKQILYGGFYLLIFFGVIFGIYQANFQPDPTCSDERQNQGEEGVDCGGPCIPCDVLNLEPPYISGDPQLLILNSGEASVLAEAFNENSSHNSEFDYVVRVYNRSNNLVESRTGSGIIYPEDFFLINENFPASTGNIGRTEVEITENRWQSNKSGLKPQLEVDNVSVLKNEDSVSVSGSVFNDGSLVVSEVKVIIILRTAGGSNLFSSQTVLDDIEPQRSTNFRVKIPVDKSVLDSMDESNIRIELSAIDF